MKPDWCDEATWKVAWGLGQEWSYRGTEMVAAGAIARALLAAKNEGRAQIGEAQSKAADRLAQFKLNSCTCRELRGIGEHDYECLAGAIDEACAAMRRE